MKRLKINVTRKCIDAAEATIGPDGFTDICPIDVAARVAGLKGADTDIDAIRTADGKTIGIPRSAQRFASRWDAEKPVKPFAFFVNVPE